MRSPWKVDEANRRQWFTTLCGGPYDGDHGEIDHLPDVIFAMTCPDCRRHVAWYYGDSPPGATPYRLSEQDGEKLTATYVYGGLNLTVEEREEELVVA